ncbi:MAG: polyprenyl diphosphate synthase [Oscillospiraceae bacterium]|nr:polyprenyl diphosphate synthase [Oscillospiraceae bacterium]
MDKINKLPEHIGIIMDGNRRWARKRMLPVAMGHKKGAEVFRERVHDFASMGIRHATFYALSTENLSREESEVKKLMELFESQLDELERITNEDDVKLVFIGDLSAFPNKLAEKMKKAECGSVNNGGMVCRLAVNYGAKAEIVRAAKLAAEGNRDVTEADFGEFLYTKSTPDVDLIIRTGGERRLSNFLLWQAAYAELYFTDTLWCDFSKEELNKALEDYSKRNRRHGK